MEINEKTEGVLKQFRSALADMDRMEQEARKNWCTQDVTMPLDIYVNLRMADRVLHFLPRLNDAYKYDSDKLKAVSVLLDLMAVETIEEEAPDEVKEAT